MIYNGGAVSDVKICYIGGGSRGWAWGMLGEKKTKVEREGTGVTGGKERGRGSVRRWKTWRREED